MFTEDKQKSKFLSLILRHQPEVIGLKLDENGWAEVSELLHLLNTKGNSWDRETLERVVATNDKQRFKFNEDKSRIRASQGHSVKVELDLPPSVPPEVLYHGTASHVAQTILKQGLKPQSRQHVHLSIDRETATKVGQRHGSPVIFRIDTQAMQQDGFVFWVSDNGVWLAKEVPAKYLALEG